MSCRTSSSPNSFRRLAGSPTPTVCRNFGLMRSSTGCILTTTHRACGKQSSRTFSGKQGFQFCGGSSQTDRHVHQTKCRRSCALPLYEYECVKCGHRFEKIEPVSASATKKCPKCGGKAERQLAAPAIQFKGSGWYVTDYAGKSSGSTAAESGGGGDGGGKSEKTAEKSRDAKSESNPAASQKADKVSDRKKK